MIEGLKSGKAYSNYSFNFLDSLDIDQDVKERLTISLTKIVNGSKEVYVTPLAKDVSPEILLAKWDKVFQANKHKMNEVLLEIEEAQRSKYGPRSISKPWKERRAGLYEYFEDKNIDYSSLDARPGSLKDKGILRPTSIEVALKFLKNNTNSGLPFLTKKVKVKERVLANFKYYLKRNDPCVLFTRTTEQGKTRNIWGYPMGETLLAMRYFIPLLGYQKKLFWRTALSGPVILAKRVTYIIKEARARGLKLVSIDFSSYDSSIKPGLERKIAEYYYYLFQVTVLQELKYIIETSIKIGIVTPEGITDLLHALPSGFPFTNETGSVGQYIQARDSKATEGDLFEIQGDDGIYAIDEDKLPSFYATFKKYGMNLNLDKSVESSDYVIFLQNLHHPDYMVDGVMNGIYPVYRALNRLIYQERWSDFEDYGIEGKDYYAIRSISILENCKYHPLFPELVKFIYKLDKYGLSASQNGITKYIKMISEKSGIEGILYNQLGDDIKGIRNFETVKLIRKLSKA